MMLNDIELKINQIEDIRELRQINQFVRNRRKAIGCKIKYKLSVGDNVTVSNGKSIDEGVIKKINRTRAVVYMRGGSWTVPFSMIRQIGDNNE